MSGPVAVDVAVIGGGPAGAATALALARAGARVALADAGDSDGEKPGESLPPSVTPLLARLGVLDPFLATAPLPCHGTRSAWGGDGALAARDFIADPRGDGWHIDRPRFDAMLIRAAEQTGVIHLRGTRLAGVAGGAERWRLTLAEKGAPVALEAALLVDATGRASALARRLGARRRRVDRLVAAVAFLDGDGAASRERTTLVEAVEDGWWYAAALPDRRLSVAFFTDPDLLVRLGAATARGWLALLGRTDHTRRRVAAGGYRLAGEPRVVAAGSGRLDRLAGDGWLAVGDAAAAHDPLASHGIGAAVEGGMRAAVAAVAALGGDAGAPRRYARDTAVAYARYLALWIGYYADERRWPDAPFWRRRHAARLAPAPMVLASGRAVQGISARD